MTSSKTPLVDNEQDSRRIDIYLTVPPNLPDLGYATNSPYQRGLGERLGRRFAHAARREIITWFHYTASFILIRQSPRSAGVALSHHIPATSMWLLYHLHHQHLLKASRISTTPDQHSAELLQLSPIRLDRHFSSLSAFEPHVLVTCIGVGCGGGDIANECSGVSLPQLAEDPP